MTTPRQRLRRIYGHPENTPATSPPPPPPTPPVREAASRETVERLSRRVDELERQVHALGTDLRNLRTFVRRVLQRVRTG